MKKFDLITILSVLLITVLFYILYFSGINKNDDIYIRVSYNNAAVYEERLDDVIDVTITITSEERVLTVVIVDNVSGATKRKTQSISSAKHIENTIHITKDNAAMIHANCRTKQCTLSTMTKSFPRPIICTNGVTVELIFENIDEYIFIP